MRDACVRKKYIIPFFASVPTANTKTQRVKLKGTCHSRLAQFALFY